MPIRVGLLGFEISCAYISYGEGMVGVKKFVVLLGGIRLHVDALGYTGKLVMIAL